MSDFWLKAIKTLRHYGRKVQVGMRAIWWDLRRPLISRPVFIIGCSRAGTTLVYKTFSESDEVGTLQRETHDFWAALHPLQSKGWASHALTVADASARDREIVSRYFYAHTGKRRFVDKNNQNGLSVSYLYALFPDAHFIYVKRSPGDNINSLIEGWGKAEEFATWSDQVPERVAVDGGRYTHWCFFLAEGWRKYVTAPVEEVCAFQYRAMNEAILAAKRRIPADQWTEICYEDLLRDPIGGFRQAFVAAGLNFTSDLERHCAAVLAKPYNAFSEIRLDKWKDGHNRTRIERVLPSVAAVARVMGYAV